jgi:hypothetical protein
MYRIFGAAALVLALALPAAAQTNVTQVEIQRLQDNIYQATTDLSELRGRDTTRATQLQTELDELREEVIYLKVKLRKERSLMRTEYADVRDRIEDFRTRARNENSYASAPLNRQDNRADNRVDNRPDNRQAAPRTSTATTTRNSVEIPSGTELDVRLTNTLNSGVAVVEDRFEATTLVDVNVDGRTVIPAGSVMRGVVTAVEEATRTNRTGRLTVSFDQVTVNGRAYPMRGTVTQAIESEGVRGEVGRIGTGAGVGAILGGILGGFKGALAGILIGAGGTIAATEGREVDLPQGSVLRVRLDSPIVINTLR